MTWFMLWLVGLLLAVVTANVSIYFLLSAGLFGWRWYARLKRWGHARRLEIPSSPRATLELRWSEVRHEDGRRGQGLVLAHVGERRALGAHTLSPLESRVRVVSLVSADAHLSALASADFEVGREIRLVLGGSDAAEPSARPIEVWNRTGTLLAGFVAANAPGRSPLAEELAAAEPPRAFVLWETLTSAGARTGAQILVVYAGAPIRLTAKRQAPI